MKPFNIDASHGRIPRWLSSIGLVCVMVGGVVGCGSKSRESAAAERAAADSSAAQMIELSKAHVDKFLTHSQTEAMRNMLGGVRAIFVAPDVGGASFLIGVDSGTGFLMRRHGEDWSDPVFYTLTETSAGEQVGIKDAHVIVLLMTDLAVDNFVNGRMVIGANGGITLGTYGISISGAGGTTGGLEMFIISTSQGLSLGGSIATIEPKPVPFLNDEIYGPHANLDAILAGPGGKFAPARGLRQDLATMVRHSWETQRGSTK